jgi:methionyl-tRNA formyltransferase
MLIQLLVDNPKSWILPYAELLKEKLHSIGHDARLIHKHRQVLEGDVLILLSCERKFNELNLNKHNLVVHESELPKGKGWSPVTWQVLEGKNDITVSLFEATSEIDAGKIYLQKKMSLKGFELLDEIKHMQGLKTIELILDFINNIDKIIGRDQNGESTFYERRSEKDSKLDINKSILEQFNLLRVCDNDRYPAWFELDGVKFNIKIYKA